MCKAPLVPTPESPAERRLRVALDATPLLGPRTGVGAFCAGALEGLGRRSDLCVSAFAVTWRRRRRLPPELPPGVRALQRSMPARPLHLAWRRLGMPAAERFLGPCDVVHGTNYVVPPTRAAARVVTVHDLTAERFPQLCDASSLAFPALVRRAVAEGAWVHTPSQFVAAEVVERLGADPTRVRAVPHGIPHSPNTASDGASGRLPNSVTAGRGPFILSVGTVEPRKDYPSLVRAFDRLAGDHREVNLVIAGGDGWGSHALDDAVEVSPWRDRIVRTGYVDEATLGALRADATLLAYPSVYEGFGFPPLEAMAAGVPVVATSAGAVPEVVGDAGVLVPPGDVDALAAALTAVLDDSDLRRQLVERGRERAAGFTWELCASGLTELYHAAADAAGASGPSGAAESSPRPR